MSFFFPNTAADRVAIISSSGQSYSYARDSDNPDSWHAVGDLSSESRQGEPISSEILAEVFSSAIRLTDFGARA